MLFYLMYYKVMSHEREIDKDPRNKFQFNADDRCK